MERVQQAVLLPEFGEIGQRTLGGGEQAAGDGEPGVWVEGAGTIGEVVGVVSEDPTVEEAFREVAERVLRARIPPAGSGRRWRGRWSWRRRS